MKSYYVELVEVGKSKLATEEINTNNLQANEVLVKASYSMISSGTELSRAFAIKKGFSYPVRPGYSLVGKVLDKGSNIDVSIGDKVFINSPHASLIRWDETFTTQGHGIYKIPQEIDEKQATALNLCLIALQGVNLCDVKIGDTVVIYGLGNIGIITALLFKKLGAKVIGMDFVENRCKLARSLGVENIYSGDSQEEYINKITNNKGADICVDVTGISKAIISAINTTKQYGQVILLGSPRQGYECDITPIFNRLHMKNIKLIGAFNQTVPIKNVEGSDNSVEKNINTICNMIINKELNIEKLINEVVDPKDCEKAYYDLMYNKDKTNCIVFDWNNY